MIGIIKKIAINRSYLQIEGILFHGINMVASSPSPKQSLGLFHLIMINVIAVDSIRTLPFSASYGFSLVFFYIIAAAVFLIPTALVSAELGTGWPVTGGVYVWVREAFGKKWSLISIWLQWMYNVVWYPTIIALVAGTATYFFDPSLAGSRWYMAISVVVIFWLSTFFNFFGMRISSWISTVGALIGTILPMLLIAFLGFMWWIQGHPLEITFSQKEFFPAFDKQENWAFLTTILFGLMGLEMVATHSADMKHVRRDYPRSLFIAVLIILFTIVTASLSIAIVVPNSQLNLATGAMQAFTIFLHSLGIDWAIPIVAGFIILGGLCGISAWIIGPTKGLMVASEDGSLPLFLRKKNRHGVPVNILWIQGVIVTILSLVFVLFPTVNGSFWILSVITAQLALVVYILLFASAIKLHYCKSEVKRSYVVPGKTIGMWLCSGIGIFCCVIVMMLGFLPPIGVGIQNIPFYETTLIGGIVVICTFPFIILKMMKKR